ncbi:carbohydrate kinase family protein [Patescibacteria group bacterium]|nr:carbohydrate kinase family protein [Patescibacteria group bacterium]
MKVIGVGTAAVDYFLKVDESFLKEFYLKPEDDVSFFSKNIKPKDMLKKARIFKKSTGGMSLNTIAILSKFKVLVSHFSNFGKGEGEEYLFKNLPLVDTSKVLKTGDTHICFCLLTKNGKERTFVYRENKKELDLFKKVDYKYLNSSDLIYITPIYLNDPLRSLEKIIKIIEKIKTPKISFTPGVFFTNLGLKKLKPIIKKTEILFLNKREIKTLTGLSKKKGSRKLTDLGTKIVVCTLGEKGVLITTKKEQLLVSAKKIKKVVDSTGSGDAFAAGFIYGYLKKKSLKESAEIGNKIAALSLSDYGLGWLNKIKPNFLNSL